MGRSNAQSNGIARSIVRIDFDQFRLRPFRRCERIKGRRWYGYRHAICHQWRMTVCDDTSVRAARSAAAERNPLVCGERPNRCVDNPNTLLELIQHTTVSEAGDIFRIGVRCHDAATFTDQSSCAERNRTDVCAHRKVLTGCKVKSKSQIRDGHLKASV